MASAGVVGMSEVVQPTSAPNSARVMGQPAMWSMIWTGAAFLFLLTIHMAMVGRR
jgi:hypothetical protein